MKIYGETLAKNWSKQHRHSMKKLENPSEKHVGTLVKSNQTTSARHELETLAQNYGENLAKNHGRALTKRSKRHQHAMI